MMVRLTPEQISLHWGLIKQVVLDLELVPLADNTMAYNNLLAKLLGDFWQCWFVYDITPTDERVLHVLILTSILEDSLSGLKYLNLQGVWAFRPFTTELQQDCLRGVRELLRNKSCSGLIATTSNPRAEQLLIDAGFVLTKRVYTLKM